MSFTPRTISTALTYAGVLPFLLLMFTPQKVAGLDTASLFTFYGAIISSFMAGALWGRAQSVEAGTGVIVASNVFALVSFATVVFSVSSVSLVVQLVLFVLLLLSDFRMFAGDAKLKWYWRLRLTVTLLVSFTYAVMLLRYAVDVGMS